MPVQLSLTPLDAGQRLFGCMVVTDLTRHRLAEQELERRVEVRSGQLRLAASVFENTLEGVMVTDTEGRILSVNPAFTEITGYNAEQAIGRNPSLLRSQRHESMFYAQLWNTLLSEGRWQGQIWNRRKNGEAYLQWSTINLVPAQSGQPACYVNVFTDVTEFWRRDDRIAHMANHDPLTDLANRSLMLDRLNHALSVAERQGKRVGVLFIDLDGFKAVNDCLGHPTGDQLLQEMANRLLKLARASDTVARIGGDEFVVLMEALDNVDECSILAEKVPVALSWRRAITNREIRVSASVGIAVYPDHGHDADTLLNNADSALYTAKAVGKKTFRFFQPTP
jgi:diguanylate cyclase (GGDEF)-like protein/PAS domain S-box-containing protein